MQQARQQQLALAAMRPQPVIGMQPMVGIQPMVPMAPVLDIPPIDPTNLGLLLTGGVMMGGLPNQYDMYNQGMWGYEDYGYPGWGGPVWY